MARATELLAKHRARGSQRFEWRYLWQAARGADHRLFAQEASSVLSLAHSPEFLAVGLQDSVRIYDTKTGRLAKTLAKSGSSLALSATGLLATASKGTVKVWRTSDWAEAYSALERMAPVAFSPDGRRLAATSFGGIHVYDSSTGKLVADLPNGMPPFAFSPRGDAIATDTSKGIVLWDVDAAKPLRPLRHSEGIFADFRMRDKTALLFSPDGNSVVAARNTLREGSVFVLDVWSSATGEKLTTLPATRNAVEHAGLVSGLAFAPGTALLASGSHDHSIRLWDVGARQCVERLHGSPSEVWAVAFTADGRSVVSGGKDGAVRLWPTNAAAKERLYEGNWTPLKFSKDGQALAAIEDQSRFVLLNLKTGEPNDQLQLTRSQWGQWAGVVSDDLRVVADPLPKGGLRVWDLPSRKSVDLESQEVHKSWAAISPDNTALLAGAKGDSALWWNLQDPGEAPLRIKSRRALFAGSGNVLITFHDRSIKLWDAKARSPKTAFPVEADLGFMSPTALSEDGGILAVGSNPVKESENAIRLWDTRSGKLLGVCKGHAQGVRWLAFCPDGETLASVGDDSALRFWNTRSQQELFSLQRLADPIRNILFSPDGHWLAAKTTSGLRLLEGSRDRDAAQPTASPDGPVDP